MKELLVKTQLGKPVKYKTSYDPSLLNPPIPRILGRTELGITNEGRPFTGVDIWNAYELSWLDKKGKPNVAMAEFRVPDNSEQIFESKNFKLYLNSFNQTQFETTEIVKETLQRDLSHIVKGNVQVNLITPDLFATTQFAEMSGIYLDQLDIDVSHYDYFPENLETSTEEVEETLYSNLFRSNCPITKQPDWASVFIKYQGRKINPKKLLQYLISFRLQNEFHEHCVERIFVDVLRYCSPSQLTVYARFTRRGGIDINPFRTNCEATTIANIRTFRQ